MNGGEVALAALGIVATVCAALIWVVKFLFTKNDKTNNRLASSIEKSANASHALQQSLAARDARDHEFQRDVIDALGKVSISLDQLDRKSDANLNAVQLIASLVEKEDAV
ncbi:hypothetical protein RQN9TF_12800 [Rhodococcus qingshengii]|uniref:hypothetical protein n=1 Tax=Rhodococcus TaxID=1827 RepID=UPI000F61D174|nr:MULTISPECIES: hypothetical protein [Rhodococcus]AZI61877.1 hypothetical protein EHW12_12370 [Rhodococcus sp. NJ-530]BDQ20084.1 hypothetical protein RQN9TF_12800 [Rhodococcus qingshengii]